MTAFAELAAATNFSFLRGASHPEELAHQARQLGLAGLGVADRNTLAGVVRGHIIAREIGLPYRVGCRLVFADGSPDIIAWPTDRAAYGRLCRLLTAGNRRARKGDCTLTLPDLLAWAGGLMLGVVPGRNGPETETVLCRLNDAFPGAVRLMAAMGYGPGDRRRLAGLKALAVRCRSPLLATNDVLYHHPDRRPLQDVITCIREHVTLAEAGRRLAANAERHLKPANEMARLFADCPEAVTESLRVLERLGFSLEDLRYQYPDEPTGAGPTPQAALERLTGAGAGRRYPEGVPRKVADQIAHELRLIARLEYAPYFLTVYDIVRFAREERGILCQGRGSAANSAVCYCLGITDVNPETSELLFERFISPERNEPPDIDVDFEHERREEVMQYVYQKYGRDRAGIAATVITYRTRSAIREVGKVFGLSEDTTGALAGSVWGWSGDGVRSEDAERIGLDPGAPAVRQALALAREIIGFPRHLSQHVGGFVITRDRLDEVIPVGNAAMEDRTFVEWDKDDLDALGILKIDVLALGMLTCIRKAFGLLEDHYGERRTLAGILAGHDPALYRMLQRADSIGVFQVESRAQMTMLPRLRPKEFYDLVIEVAIVRPGPIQGDMVHPYLRRRQGLEKVDFPSPAGEFGPPDELAQVLGRTLGVPLFQEQAMRIAIVAAGFEPGEADRLRRAMATFRRTGMIGFFRDKFIDGMVRRGYPGDFAERCFRQIEGFGEYGFPESHAASFALLVYVSAWLKCHYPDVFCAALLNAQPMGFYAAAQIVRDAQEHGVEVRPVEVNRSAWDNGVERGGHPVVGGKRAGTSPARLHPRHASMADDIRTTHAVRLGFRQIKGFSEEDAVRLIDARGAGYDSVRDLWLRSGITRAAIERLAEADAFRSLGLDRRAALWAVRALEPGAAKFRLPLFDRAELAEGAMTAEAEMKLPPMPLGTHVVEDYRSLGLSLKAHPVAFLRHRVTARGAVRNEALADMPSGRRVTVAGLVLVRQRPGTASGVIFATLEDETGIANAIIWPKVFERFRPVVLGARFVLLTGRLQSESGVVHVVADRLHDETGMLAALADHADVPETAGPADQVLPPGSALRNHLHRHPRNEPVGADLAEAVRRTRSVMPKGRNFH